MRAWLFQANPDKFDLDGYLADQDAITWGIRQKQYVSEIVPGDNVFIWRPREAAGIWPELLPQLWSRARGRRM